MPSPIRIALVGLSSGGTGWAVFAHLPYLLSPRGLEKYKIVALLNSSVESARRAIEVHKLSGDIKAYGNPDDLANDPDVDLVVNSTFVTKHYETTLPSIKAGKAVYVEWPLAHNIQRVDELASAAEASGSPSIIGLQGWFTPALLKVRELLEQGAIGKILSTEIKAGNGVVSDREFIRSNQPYIVDRSKGGNEYVVGVGHGFDNFQHILGDFHDLTGHLQILRPEVRVRDPKTLEIVGTAKTDLPDLIVFNGTLGDSNPLASKGASVIYRFRRGQTFPGEPSLVLAINGEKGEIRLTSQKSPFIHAMVSEGLTIELHDFATDKVQNVEWKWEPWQEELPLTARIVAQLYEHYAAGKLDKIPDIKNAYKRHHQLEDIISKWQPLA